MITQTTVETSHDLNCELRGQAQRALVSQRTQKGQLSACKAVRRCPCVRCRIVFLLENKDCL